jgi:hypothetical protein
MNSRLRLVLAIALMAPLWVYAQPASVPTLGAGRAWSFSYD